MVFAISGDEGSGKSTLAMALCGIDPGFTSSRIYYFWREYLKANQDAIKDLARHIPKADFDRNNVYDIRPEDLTTETINPPAPGSFLLYDESATQMFNRAAMSDSNIQQVKLFIANRFIRLVHLLCVPKVTSLDKYIREERLKYFIYIVKRNSPDLDPNKAEYTAYVWGKESIAAMGEAPQWKKQFKDQEKIEKNLCPDFKITLPNLENPKYINPEILRDYKAKKTLYNLRQTLDVEKQVEDKETKPKIDYSTLIVQPGETKAGWVKRTGKSPTSYQHYRCPDTPK